MDYGANISPIPSPNPFKEEEEEEQAEAEVALTQKDPLTSTPTEPEESKAEESSRGSSNAPFKVPAPSGFPFTGGSSAFHNTQPSSTFGLGLLRPPLKVCKPTPVLLAPDCVQFFESLVEFANVHVNLHSGEVLLTRSPTRYG